MSTNTVIIKLEDPPLQRNWEERHLKGSEKSENLLCEPSDLVSDSDDVDVIQKSFDAINNNCSTDLNTPLQIVVSDSSVSTDRPSAINSLPECETDLFESSLSLREELNDSTQEDNSMDAACSSKKTRNVLTRCSSFDESFKSNSREEVNIPGKEGNLGSERSSMERTEQFSDSATESEFASYPDRTTFSKVNTMVVPV